MSASLVFNLLLLVAAGALLMWFPDRLTLIPLILSKVTPPIATNGDGSGSAGRSRARPRPRAAARRRPGASRTAKAKKRPKKAKRAKTVR